MRNTFWPNRMFERQSSQNSHTGLKFSQRKEKECAFHENCTKRSFQVMSSTFSPNRICDGKFVKIVTLASNSLQNGKTVRFSGKLYKNPLFRSCGGRFGQIAFFNLPVSKIALREVKFTPIRQNNRLSTKIVENVLFWPCGGRFGQIAFFNVPHPKIAQGTEINANTWKQ